MLKLNLRETIAKIDMLGLVSGTAAVILLLIPTSEGGHAGTPWNSPEVRGKSPLLSAALQLPLVIAQSIVSTLAGLYMSYYNRYVEVIWVGFGMWTLGAGLLVLSNEAIHIGLVSFSLVILGTGTGCVFQPTLVALQAHCPKAQRAVVTSNRNFMRMSGAAVGLAVSSAVLANVLKASLPPRLLGVANNTFATPNLSIYSAEDQAAIKTAYTAASRAVSIWCVPLIGVCFLLTALVRDRGLVRKEERESVTPPAEGSEASATLGSRDPEKGLPKPADGGKDGAPSTTSTADVSVDESPDASRRPSVCSEKSKVEPM